MKNSMKMFSSKTNDGKETIKLMPTFSGAPFVEGMYLPGKKVLTLIGSSIYDTYRMVPKLKPSGDFVKNVNAPGGIEQERVLISTNFDYQIEKFDEIVSILAELTGESLESISDTLTTLELVKDEKVNAE